MKNRPCREAASTVAGSVFPMVCIIMLFMTIQPLRTKVTHWKRRAAVPMRITSGSSRKIPIRCPERIPHRMDANRRATVDTFTQNQNASFTRLFFPARS